MTSNQFDKHNSGWARTVAMLGVLFVALGSAPRVAVANPIVDALNGLSCAGQRYGSDLTCTAGEFAAVVNITHVGDPNAACNEGDYFTLRGQLDLQNSNATRYNVGFFTGENGNDPRSTIGQCSVATFPNTPSPWFSSDGNACGDFIAQGQSQPVVQNLKVLCTANAQSELVVPYVVSYQQTPQACNGPGDVTPGSPSKCNSGTAVVSNVVVVPRAAANYRFDEPGWNGNSGEVTDSSDNGIDGTGLNGATTASSTPAIPGDPGTCGYGVFDGSNDEVRIPHDSRLQSTTALTYAAWIRPNTWSGSIRQVMSKSVHGGGAGRAQMGIFSEGGVLKGRAMTLNGNATSGVEVTTALPALNTWTHVALVFAGNRLTLYINGVVAQQQTFSSTTLRTNNDPFTIGNDFGRSYYFSGNIDEARVYTSALSTAQVIGVKNDTHPCMSTGNSCGPIPNAYPVYGGTNLRIDEDVTINNGTSTSTVQRGNNNGNAVQTDGNVVTASLTLPPIEPAIFPSTGSGPSPSYSGTQIINSAVQANFNSITLNNSSNITFTGGGPFYIDTLTVHRNVTLTFGAGIYFIKNFFVDQRDVNIIANGAARIYIGNQFDSSGGNNLTINSGGSAANFVVFLYPGAVFNADSDDLNFTGVIYGPNSGTITIEEDATITGAIFGGGVIDINEDTRINYSQTIADQVASITTCFNTVGISHYAISHGGTGITCAPTLVTFTAHDAGHNTVTPAANTTITVTAPAPGTWSLSTGTPAGFTSSGNQANYTFQSGEQSVVLALDYPQVGSVNINVIDNNNVTEGATEDPLLSVARAALLWSPINTQISDKPSNTGFGAQSITLQAVRASDNNASVCVPGFPDGSIRSIEIGAECNNPAACAGRQVSITNNATTTPVATNNDNGATATSNYTPVNLLFGINATADLVIQYPDAGLMSLHAKYNLTSNDPNDYMNGTSGSSNPFVVRPFGFRIDNIAYGATNNPGGTASGGAGFAPAEADFSARISALLWQAADDGNVDGIPDNTANLSDNGVTLNFDDVVVLSADTTAGTYTPAGGVLGNITNGTLPVGTFSSAVDDSITLNNLAYDNVGSIVILASTLNYLAEPTADIVGHSAVVGRFYPDHYTLLPDVVTPGCGSFTYMGQPFSPLDFTVQAQGLLNGVVTNYDTARGYSTGTVVSLAEDIAAANDGIDLSARFTDPAGDWSVGGFDVMSVTDTFARSAAGPDGPYTQLVLGITVDDMLDNRPMQTLDMNPDTAGDCTITSTCTGTRLSAGVFDVRYGRLNLLNAFGSELVPLVVPFRAEYYDSTQMGFLLSGADSCTSYDGSTMATVSTVGLTPANLSYSGSSTTAGGLPNALLPITARINPAQVGSAVVQLPVPDWLKFDWDNMSATPDTDPQSTITFGIYGGNDSTIYLREVIPGP